MTDHCTCAALGDIHARQDGSFGCDTCGKEIKPKAERPMIDRCAIAFLAKMAELAVLDGGTVDKSPEEAFDEAPPNERRIYVEALQAVLDEVKVSTMAAALAPFAAYADERHAMPDDLAITTGSSFAKRQLTMGDCYSAKAALEGN